MINKKNKLNLLTNLVQQKGADFYLLSTTDEFLNEYVPEENMRLKWLTNFTGSNGYALISKKHNYFLLTDDISCKQKKNLIKPLKLLILIKKLLQILFLETLKKQKFLLIPKSFQKISYRI